MHAGLKVLKMCSGYDTFHLVNAQTHRHTTPVILLTQPAEIKTTTEN